MQKVDGSKSSQIVVGMGFSILLCDHTYIMFSYADYPSYTRLTIMQLLDAVNKQVATPHTGGIYRRDQFSLACRNYLFVFPSLLPFSLLCLSVLFLSFSFIFYYCYVC